jgi:ABC-type lipoprotein export system ATPase subunit
MQPGHPYIVCQDLFKIYKVAGQDVVALRGLDLGIRQGEMMAIVGPSGSGKSTLLSILAGYDVPSAGSVVVNGRDLVKMSSGEVVEYRREGTGFVWQQVSRNLVPYLSAQQNVELPMLLANVGRRYRSERARTLLEFVGLAGRAKHTIEKLSGGEQQRVAIATALANNPPLILADEPTGELDSQTGQQIIDLLRSINSTYGTTIVIVTHDLGLAGQVDRVVAMSDGKTSVEIVPTGVRGANGTRELAVVDSSGRLQVPKEYLERLRITGHASLSLDGDQVVIRPVDR